MFKYEKVCEAGDEGKRMIFAINADDYKVSEKPLTKPKKNWHFDIGCLNVAGNYTEVIVEVARGTSRFE